MVDGGIPTHERYKIWCQSEDGNVTNENETWVSLMTPDGVAQRTSLIAQVMAKLPRPEVEFVDHDLDYGWLWVQVPHHVAITPPETLEVSDSATDPSGWAPDNEVEAWIRATPIAFDIFMQTEAGEEELGSCDLTTATSQHGCLIRFTHASTITDDDLFHGAATLEWTLESNAGTFDGVGPITSNATFEVQVAEAMAVTRPAN